MEGVSVKRNLAVFIGTVATLLASTPLLLAHHSLAAEFDTKTPVTLKGTVTKVEWQNPHVYICIDVPHGGKAVHWTLEGSAPNGLYRQGWRKDTLKRGDVIVVQAFLAKDEPSLAKMRTITMPDGRKFFFGADDGRLKR